MFACLDQSSGGEKSLFSLCDIALAISGSFRLSNRLSRDVVGYLGGGLGGGGRWSEESSLNNGWSSSRSIATYTKPSFTGAVNPFSGATICNFSKQKAVLSWCCKMILQREVLEQYTLWSCRKMFSGPKYSPFSSYTSPSQLCTDSFNRPASTCP